jgi:hypothetical protein
MTSLSGVHLGTLASDGLIVWNRLAEELRVTEGANILMLWQKSEKVLTP